MLILRMEGSSIAIGVLPWRLGESVGRFALPAAAAVEDGAQMVSGVFLHGVGVA